MENISSMGRSDWGIQHGATIANASNISNMNASDMPQTEIVLTPYSMPHLLITSIILGTMILATIIGNVFVVAAIILERNLHNVTNYLIASLAIADLMVAALVMPLAAVNEVSQKWFLGPEVCDMWISMDVLCCTSSILHLVAIALDRYWAITRVDYIRNRSAKRILFMIGVSWVLSLCISVPPLFGWKDGQSDPNMTGQCVISQDWGYTIFSTFGAFYLPLMIMMIIYFKIFRAAKNRIRKKRFKTLAQGAPRPYVCSATEGNGTVLQPLNSSVSQSPEPSINLNGSVSNLNDANKNVNKQNNHLSVTPPTSPLLRGHQEKRSSFLDITKAYFDIRKSNSPKKKEKDRKEKLEQKRERKAARTLGIITGTFVFCWLPFFIQALVLPFCKEECVYPSFLFSIIVWLGYFNSLLNPIIYTIFNPDFRLAFRKILFGKYRGQYQRR